MIGKVVGFIDESTHQILLEMFLDESYVYDSSINFTDNFFSLKELENQKDL